MDHDVREPEGVEAPEVLEEGQAVTGEVMACCKAGTNSARV